jgi:S-adenosyl-L-methionine hydrolase (adenosine-forming)
VGACHGVITRICPSAQILDVTHGIPRHDIRAGALTLRDALPYLPGGVHLAVVDPEVGCDRRAIAVRTADDQFFVGPDTGMHQPAAAGLGGVVEAASIGNSEYRLKPTSATFHGRDIFSPVAAHLAAGKSLSDVGDLLDPAVLVQFELPSPTLEDDVLFTKVLTVDRFGNIVLNVDREGLAETGLSLDTSVEVAADGSSCEVPFVSTFGDVGVEQPLLYVDAQQMLALAVNRGSAADLLNLNVDSEVRLRPLLS